MRRRDFIGLGAAAAVSASLPRFALAQQNPKKRLGLLFARAVDDPLAVMYRAAFWEGMAKQGWGEPSLITDYRWSADTAEAAAQPAAELVAQKPNVLFAATTPPTVALVNLTKTIPIIFAFTSWTTISPLVQSFNKPGGNLTGFVNTADTGYIGKYFDFLKQLKPTMSGVALIINPDSAPGGTDAVTNVANLGAAQGIKVIPYLVRSTTQITDAVQSVAADGTLAVYVFGDAFLNSNRAIAVAEVAKYRLVAIYGQQLFTTDGGLISYAPDPVPDYRGAGEYAGIVLNGANPGDLPIQVGPFSLTVNMKTAKEQGITIPLAILAGADQVIE